MTIKWDSSGSDLLKIILPIIVIRRIERVLIDWREKKEAEIREKGQTMKAK